MCRTTSSARRGLFPRGKRFAFERGQTSLAHFPGFSYFSTTRVGYVPCSEA